MIRPLRERSLPQYGIAMRVQREPSRERSTDFHQDFKSLPLPSNVSESLDTDRIGVLLPDNYEYPWHGSAGTGQRRGQVGSVPLSEAFTPRWGSMEAITMYVHSEMLDGGRGVRTIAHPLQKTPPIESVFWTAVQILLSHGREDDGRDVQVRR